MIILAMCKASSCYDNTGNPWEYNTTFELTGQPNHSGTVSIITPYKFEEGQLYRIVIQQADKD